MSEVETLLINNVTGAHMNLNQVIKNMYMGKSIITTDNIDIYHIIVLCIILTVMGLVITNIFTINIKDRKQIYGLLLSVGASNHDLYIMSWIEIILYALVSFPLGIFLGYAGTKLIYDYTRTILLERFTTMFPIQYTTHGYSFIRNDYIAIINFKFIIIDKKMVNHRFNEK